MRTTYAGVIGCNMADDFFESLINNRMEQYQWKKLFESDSRLDAGHTAEVVADIDSIATDEDITVVFLSNKYLHVAPQLIKAGKAIRTV